MKGEREKMLLQKYKRDIRRLARRASRSDRLRPAHFNPSLLLCFRETASVPFATD